VLKSLVRRSCVLTRGVQAREVQGYPVNRGALGSGVTVVQWRLGTCVAAKSDKPDRLCWTVQVGETALGNLPGSILLVGDLIFVAGFRFVKNHVLQ
jgi:hypothetical protein